MEEILINMVRYYFIPVPLNGMNYRIEVDDGDILLLFDDSSHIDQNIIWLSDTDKHPIENFKIYKFFSELNADDYIYLNVTEKKLKKILIKYNLYCKSWIHYPNEMYYIPDYGIQKYPQEQFYDDIEKYRNAADELLIIEIKNN